MTIKQGTLVKAWDDIEEGYVIGRVVVKSSSSLTHVYSNGNGRSFKNAVEIPPELTKALEELK